MFVGVDRDAGRRQQAIYIFSHLITCKMPTNVICNDIVSHIVAEVVVDYEGWRHRIIWLHMFEDCDLMSTFGCLV